MTSFHGISNKVQRERLDSYTALSLDICCSRGNSSRCMGNGSVCWMRHYQRQLDGSEPFGPAKVPTATKSSTAVCMIATANCMTQCGCSWYLLRISCNSARQTMKHRDQYRQDSSSGSFGIGASDYPRIWRNGVMPVPPAI